MYDKLIEMKKQVEEQIVFQKAKLSVIEELLEDSKPTPTVEPDTDTETDTETSATDNIL